MISVFHFLNIMVIANTGILQRHDFSNALFMCRDKLTGGTFNMPPCVIANSDYQVFLILQ